MSQLSTELRFSIVLALCVNAWEQYHVGKLRAYLPCLTLVQAVRSIDAGWHLDKSTLFGGYATCSGQYHTHHPLELGLGHWLPYQPRIVATVQAQTPRGRSFAAQTALPAHSLQMTVPA